VQFQGTNKIKKEAEKILKSKDLKTEIQHMWKGKARVTPVIIGATGTSSKSFRQYLSNISGKYEIKELKNSHIGHCTRLSASRPTNKTVQNTFRFRNNITRSTNCKYRTAATLHTLEIWLVSGL
jgi:hypothetical protein